MPMAPKKYRASERKPWQHTGQDRRKGFRGRNRIKAKHRIGERDDWKCRACGRLVAGQTSILDHVIPISKGGGHEDENLQTLCIECSNEKTIRESRG